MIENTDRIQLILAALADRLKDLVADRPGLDDLRALADGIALAVDHGAVVDVWTWATPDQEVEWLADIITGKRTRGETNASTRRMEVLVARRLANVAASLVVRGEARVHEARALWTAAERLLGFEFLTIPTFT